MFQSFWLGFHNKKDHAHLLKETTLLGVGLGPQEFVHILGGGSTDPQQFVHASFGVGRSFRRAPPPRSKVRMIIL